ncbi:hypothetical protein [Pseudomonas lundensis]|uniref:hypothetical protein n=1 Tax=Pseudomonas lundensis TaxID=86185 RepID=UPI000BA2B440|nr:hypothetical protein [Pseudomonas lundensis]OZY32049.1 hypothetical protein CJF36_14010 [Pseudomonas lundensis]
MNSFGPLAIIAIGAAAFYLYRSHKRKVDYESVCEVSQALSSLADKAGAYPSEKGHPYEVMAAAIREAQAAVIAKRIFDSGYSSHIQRQLLRSFAPDLLESIGIYRGSARFGRCYSGLAALAGDFERLHATKKQW